jgi:hypothetical protein
LGADFLAADFFAPVLLAGLPAFFAADFLAPFFADLPAFLAADFFAPFFFGTFAPSARASDNPIAIACLRLVTFLPLRPDLSLPFFISSIALSTFFPDFLEYLAMEIVYGISIKIHAGAGKGGESES